MIFFSFSFTGQEIPLEVAIEMLSGTKIVYQPDYNDMNSVLAIALVNKFVAEVALYVVVCYQIATILLCHNLTDD